MVVGTAINVSNDVLPPDRTVLGWVFPIMILRWEKESSMKESKFSEAQIAFVLKQAEDGTAIGQICQKVGITEATFEIGASATLV
jgi:hypothetical protein